VYPSDIASAHQALSCFGLEDKLFERVDRLSGGERQRVGLARALVAPAKVWFVDEPLSSLDPSRASQAIEQLTQIARARGTTLVASLHQVDTALASFSRVIGLRHGSIMFDLPASKVTDLHLSQLYEQTPSQLLAGNRAVAYEPSDGETKTARPLVLNCR
jgi:phosphonate transport system ATP-binding protein